VQFSYQTFDILDPKNDFMRVILFPSEFTVTYRRSYMKIQAVFAQVMAIFEFFLFIFRTFVFKKFYYQKFKEIFFNSYCEQKENEVKNKAKLEINDNEEEKQIEQVEPIKSQHMEKGLKSEKNSPIPIEQNQSRVSEFHLIQDEKTQRKQQDNLNMQIVNQKISRLKKEIQYPEVNYGNFNSLYIALCWDCYNENLESKYYLLKEINDAILNMDIKLIVDGILDVRKIKEVFLSGQVTEFHKIPNSKYLTLHSRKPNDSQVNDISKMKKDLEEEEEEEEVQNDEGPKIKEEEEIKGEIIIVEKGKIIEGEGEEKNIKRLSTIKKRKRTFSKRSEGVIAREPRQPQKSKFYQKKGTNASN